MAEPIPEFDCIECGRRMTVLIGDIPDPPRCNPCRSVYRWYRYPELAEVIDPKHRRTVKEDA